MTNIFWTVPGHAWLKNEIEFVKGELKKRKITGLGRSHSRSASPARLLDRQAEQHEAAINQDRRILLETLLTRVQAQKMVPLGETAAFGQMVRVTIEHADGSKAERTFVLGGVDESIVHLPYEVISCASPMGRAVRGKAIGDEAEYRVEGHTLTVTILSIEAPPTVDPSFFKKAA